VFECQNFVSKYHIKDNLDCVFYMQRISVIIAELAPVQPATKIHGRHKQTKFPMHNYMFMFPYRLGVTNDFHGIT